MTKLSIEQLELTTRLKRGYLKSILFLLASCFLFTVGIYFMKEGEHISNRSMNFMLTVLYIFTIWYTLQHITHIRFLTDDILGRERRVIIPHKIPENVVQCDTKDCDYSIASDGTPLIVYVNQPCPVCGENLCMMEDYERYSGFMKDVRFLNKHFSWIRIFMSDKRFEQKNLVSFHKEIKVHKNED